MAQASIKAALNVEQKDGTSAIELAKLTPRDNVNTIGSNNPVEKSQGDGDVHIEDVVLEDKGAAKQVEIK